MTQIGIIGDPRASDPAHHAITVVPSNTDDLPAASTAIYVGGGGSLKVTMLGGEILTFGNSAGRVAPDPGDPRVDQQQRPPTSSPSGVSSPCGRGRKPAPAF